MTPWEAQRMDRISFLTLYQQYLTTFKEKEALILAAKEFGVTTEEGHRIVDGCSQEEKLKQDMIGKAYPQG